MKLRFLIASALIAVAAQAFAHESVYFGILSGLNENPQNASPGTGTAKVTIDFDLITMRVETSFSGLTGNTTASHIHFGSGPGTNGSVATMLPSFTGFPLGVKSGTFDGTFDMAQAASYNPSFITNNGGTVATAFNAFVSKLDSGFGYLNIHTTTFSGGEVRANLTAVPEPSTVALFAIGFGAIALRRKIRR